MKKSVIFLINGLGIEKPGSYSVSIDQSMPKLCRTKETSFYTTAITNSLEYRSAYQQFFLGDTYRTELKYIKENVLNDKVGSNPTYQSFVQSVSTPNSKLHVFVEPTNEQVVEQINSLINTLSLDSNKEVYLHLIVSQLTINEYKQLISMVNYIKYHINTHITVGFIVGKEYFPEELSKEEMDVAKKLFFYCSAERWSDTDKKLLSLQEANILPCNAPGFCATTACTINNGDTILFFNTKRTNYDKFINVIYSNAKDVFKTEEYSLPIYSIIRLDSKYNIPYFAENIIYDNSLSLILEKAKKKALIISEEKNIELVNFLANGRNYVNNPNIMFMKLDNNYLSNKENIRNIIDLSPYELIIFDYHMDTSKTINDLKEQLEQIDVVLGHVAELSENKHSLFITSLYGIKKEMPLASYNNEMVMIDYEMQIPIFFFDYSYPHSKYVLFPGDTNAILSSAIRCIWDDPQVDTLIQQKGLVNNILSVFNK